MIQGEDQKLQLSVYLLLQILQGIWRDNPLNPSRNLTTSYDYETVGVLRRNRQWFSDMQKELHVLEPLPAGFGNWVSGIGTESQRKEAGSSSISNQTMSISHSDYIDLFL